MILEKKKTAIFVLFVIHFLLVLDFSSCYLLCI